MNLVAVTNFPLPSHPAADQPRLITTISALSLGFIGATGSITGLGALKSILPGQPEMVPATAASLILGGIALLVHRKGNSGRFATFCAVAPVLVGLISLISYALTQPPLRSMQVPGVQTGFGLFLLGLALMLRIRNLALPVAEFCALAAGLVNCLALTGYALGYAPHFRDSSGSGIAVHTALAMIALAAAILMTGPDEGMLAILKRRTVPGLVARLLFPLPIVVPLMMSLVLRRNPLFRLSDPFLLNWAFGVGNILVFALLIWLTTRLLDDTDRRCTDALDALHRLNQRLESRDSQRTRQLVQEVEERKRSENAVREISGRLLNLQDQERRRIARELHDTTSQLLAALEINLSMVATSGAELDSRAGRALSTSLELARECSRQIRTVSYLLHPPLLDELGLASALRAYTEGYAKRTGIQVILESDPTLTRLPRDVELTMFRIVQEALANIHRHSGSGTATIRLDRSSTEVILEIEDQGRGMTPGSPESSESMPKQLGVGISGMRERARQLGGRLEIQSGSGGTMVRVRLPVEIETESTTFLSSVPERVAHVSSRRKAAIASL